VVKKIKLLGFRVKFHFIENFLMCKRYFLF